MHIMGKILRIDTYSMIEWLKIALSHKMPTIVVLFVDILLSLSCYIPVALDALSI